MEGISDEDVEAGLEVLFEKRDEAGIERIKIIVGLKIGSNLPNAVHDI